MLIHYFGASFWLHSRVDAQQGESAALQFSRLGEQCELGGVGF